MRRKALKYFKTLKNFLAKYRVDLEKGKIYSLRTAKEVAQVKINGYHVHQTTQNYKRINIKRSHLIFWAGHSYLPSVKMCIDHVDGNKTNDCIHNLQILSNSQNMAKSKLNRPKNVYYGVYLDKRWNLYNGRIMKNGKRYYTKYSKDMQQAAQMRDELLLQLYWNEYVKEGFMPPLNFPELLQKYAQEKNIKKL